jgi:hypothetical protein
MVRIKVERPRLLIFFWPVKEKGKEGKWYWGVMGVGVHSVRVFVRREKYRFADQGVGVWMCVCVCARARARGCLV